MILYLSWYQHSYKVWLYTYIQMCTCVCVCDGGKGWCRQRCRGPIIALKSTGSGSDAAHSRTLSPVDTHEHWLLLDKPPVPAPGTGSTVFTWVWWRIFCPHYLWWRAGISALRMDCQVDSVKHMLLNWKFTCAWGTVYNSNSERYMHPKGPSSQGYGFSSGHVWMWELDYKESWAPRN